MRFEEKEECNGCLYSEYDYDGKETYFLACRKGKKCTGCIKPNKEEHWHEIGGKKLLVYQEQWLSYEGVTWNLVIFLQDGDGKLTEILHAGHCKGLLTERERIEMCEFALSMRSHTK